MKERPLWLNRIREAWSRRSIVWLSGVRRVGKTTLARMFPEAEYMNCDLPSSERTLEDPELFLGSQAEGGILVLDEIHNLQDPARLLKIAADEYPGVKVLATGSSTLAATGKFRDSLTGRKEAVHLFPVLWEECAGFLGAEDLDRRLLNGGLPEPLLSDSKDANFFNEWIDSFYARDILELFSIRNRQGFLSLFRILLRQSGGQVDYTRLSNSSEMSRPTVKAHIEALAAAHAVYLLFPFHGGGKREIVSRPKCYGFDTGFVTFEKGWGSIRDDDRGLLWEHLVLDSLRFRFGDEGVFYWQDKSQREIDFVIRRQRDSVDVVECKVNPDKFDGKAVEVFRESYPKGNNYVVSPAARKPHRIRRNGLVFTVCGVRDIG